MPTQNIYYPEIPTEGFLNMNDTQRVVLKILTFNSEKVIIDFGDGTIKTYNYGADIIHDYSENFTGAVKIIVKDSNLRAIKSIQLIDWGKANVNGIVGNNRVSSYNLNPDFLFQFPKLEDFIFDQYFYGGNGGSGSGIVDCKTLLSGDWSQIPSYLKKLVFVNTDFNGNTAIFNIDNIISKSDYQLKTLQIGGYGMIRNIRIKGKLSNLFSNLEELTFAGANTLGTDYSVNICKLPSKLRKIILVNSSSGIISSPCTLEEISNNIPNLNYFDITANNANGISGNINVLNKNITFLRIYGNNTVTGNILDLPPTSYRIDIGGNNTITGDIKDISTFCTYFFIEGKNTIGGDIDNLHLNIQTFHVYGNNLITGDIKNIKTNFVKFEIGGFNTIYGDLINLQHTIQYFAINGNNLITGDVRYISQSFKSFNLGGNNYVYGNIADIKYMIEVLIVILGNNTINGNIEDCKNAVRIEGKNTISGDISNVQSTMNYLYISGNNTISGNIENLTSNKINSLYIYGKNEISGNIGNLQSSSINFLYIGGNNTINGDIGGIPNNLKNISIFGKNNINQYTSQNWQHLNSIYLEIWNKNIDNTPNNSNTMSSSTVDSLLIDLSNAPLTKGTIILRGSIAKRTSASDNAVNLLRSKNVSLNLN